MGDSSAVEQQIDQATEILRDTSGVDEADSKRLLEEHRAHLLAIQGHLTSSQTRQAEQLKLRLAQRQARNKQRSGGEDEDPSPTRWDNMRVCSAPPDGMRMKHSSHVVHFLF